MMDRLAILAPGLLGGSVARAARERRLARHIALWARRPEARAALRAQPWCDSAPDTAAEAARDAALVVIAAPVDRIADLAEEVAPALPSGAVITDVGSVKAALCVSAFARVRAASRGDAEFVGAHPMAGSEKTGWEHSDPRLFEHRTCFVTPLPENTPSATAATANFWAALGAQVVRTAPEEHDRIVAHISHLPQLLASTLCAVLDRTHSAWGAYAGGGLRDTTRIAGSDPALWQTIFAANRGAVLEALREFTADLAAAERALAAGDVGAIAALMERGRRFRSAL